jgi:hypothetical protein
MAGGRAGRGIPDCPDGGCEKHPLVLQSHVRECEESGKAMDAGFRFELGVFSGGFIPTAANTSQWDGNWVSAQRAVYNDANGLFTAEFTVTGNAGAFSVRVQAYVRGFGGVKGDQWILFRAPSWTWPAADPLNPIGLNWNATSATQVITGPINSSGTPYLMKTTVVAGSVPPSTSWSQWQAAQHRHERTGR